MSEFDPVDLTDVEPDSLEGTWVKRIAELEAEARKRESLLQSNYVKRAELEAELRAYKQAKTEKGLE